ncbi:response regulator [Nannocystis sp. SCPEA4]|uniref:LytR/AlgR family response regulator transcription factor n=1 Tax=Nannocystis sp. SCPEA4 TaxID=2996787 RepID=UPI0022718C14|nr:response regulator [Nannocystis sp. SCPEA4]MCY1062415.1 response regulator [Nannocystis sp. SCPEA4]
MAIRALIVDDEPLARDLLREMLAAHPQVAVVGECRSGAEAVQAIGRLAPDVVFLDVQMPEMNGFEVVASVGAARMPRVVFVTAHDRYAVQAFEVHALDYLLKPFDDERLARAVARLDAAGDGLDARLAALLAGRTAPRPERLVIHDGSRALFVPLAEVDWIEAAGKYVVVHAGEASHVLRESISTLAAELDPHSFARIHRSTIVRIERIREVRSLLGGDYEVVLRDGTALTTSRGHRHRVQALLGRRG